MCGGVEYVYQGEKKRVYFPNPQAHLPVRLKNASIDYLPWGRRKQQLGQLPMGGWARHDSIKQGVWDKWFPKPVKIIVSQFMEKDMESNSHWFELPRGQWIQGLIAHNGNERRIYVVTITPVMDDAVHDRWPRIMS